MTSYRRRMEGGMPNVKESWYFTRQHPFRRLASSSLGECSLGACRLTCPSRARYATAERIRVGVLLGAPPRGKIASAGGAPCQQQYLAQPTNRNRMMTDVRSDLDTVR